MEYILKTFGIVKNYHGACVLNDVSIEMKPGRIYGLIGQNGAGKTTLMRIIAGLSFPNTGTLELFGKSDEGDITNGRKKMGCMIEYPSLSPDLDANDNLEIHRLLRGIEDKGVKDELLKLVGLAGTGKKRVRNFSLGMRQRLGIAIAMMGNPEILVLDEPINGLDPVGIYEIRELLKKLCDEKRMTLLISSHNLPHLYKIATDYIIIHRGAVKQKITAEELDKNCENHFVISCTEPDKLAELVETKFGVQKYKVLQNGSVELHECLHDKEHLAKLLFENGIIITNLSLERESIEEYFMSVIGGELNV